MHNRGYGANSESVCRVVTSLPFEWIYLHLNEVNVDRCEKLLKDCLRSSAISSLPGMVKAILRRIHVEHASNQAPVLDACMGFLVECLRRAALEPRCLRASKNAIFVHEAIAELCLNWEYLSHRGSESVDIEPGLTKPIDKVVFCSDCANLPSFLNIADPADRASRFRLHAQDQPLGGRTSR